MSMRVRGEIAESGYMEPKHTHPTFPEGLVRARLAP